MLREVMNVQQLDPAVIRRWFCDDYFDLFVWERPDGGIVEFQLCYDKLVRERVLKWRAATGFAHHRIDSGEQTPDTNMTPIMVADGVMPLTAVLERFDAHAAEMDPPVRDFVRGRLVEYGARPATLDKPEVDA